MIDACDSCPFREEPGTTCHARRAGHRPFCTPKYRDYVVRRTGATGRLPVPEPPADPIRSALVSATHESPASATLHPGPPATPAGPGKVRVGLLCPCFVQGGAEAWMLSLARTVDPARVSWMGTVVVGDQIDSTRVDAMGGHMPVAQGRGAARALAANCDVLVVWAIDDLPGLLKGLARPPSVIAVSHGPVESDWARHHARSESVDHWVGVSELAVPPIDAAGGPGVPDVPASVIWNAVDTERMAVRRSRAAMREAWGVPRDAPVALYMGRLSLEKRPERMIGLAASLPEPWHTVVVGAGNKAPALERAARTNPRLHPVGADPAAGDCLGAADVLVVPSEYESFGLTIAEGIWAGVPVVTTPVGLAKLAPGSTHVVPADPTGLELADAVIAAHEGGAAAGAEAIRPRLGPEGFGRAWSNLIVEMGREAVAGRRAESCPHRQPPSCGCRSEAARCGKGKGVQGYVWLPDCVRCLGESGSAMADPVMPAVQPRAVTMPADYDRVTILTMPARHPGHSDRVRAMLAAHGVREDRIAVYLNRDWPTPDGWRYARGAYNHLQGFKAIVRAAQADGLSSLLFVEDDAILTPDFAEVVASAGPHLPADWDLLYYGALHLWHATEDVSPHLLRLGGSLGTHFLGIRASAFPALIDLPEYTATDSAIGEQLHGRLAAYAVWPSVARQAPGVSEVSGGGACPDEWWAVRSRPAC